MLQAISLLQMLFQGRWHTDSTLINLPDINPKASHGHDNDHDHEEEDKKKKKTLSSLERILLALLLSFCSLLAHLLCRSFSLFRFFLFCLLILCVILCVASFSFLVFFLASSCFSFVHLSHLTSCLFPPSWFSFFLFWRLMVSPIFLLFLCSPLPLYFSVSLNFFSLSCLIFSLFVGS